MEPSPPRTSVSSMRTRRTSRVDLFNLMDQQSGSTLSFRLRRGARVVDLTTVPDPALFEEGVNRFDDGRFWDAHESWEDL